MMKRLSAFILAVAAALSLCACADSKSDGLEVITVNGGIVDLTQDKERIAETLGEDYSEWETFLSLPTGEQTAYLLCIDTIYETGYTATGYSCNKVDSGEPAGVTVWGDMPADMSRTEYKRAYEGLYCSTAYSSWDDDFDEYIIVQADEKILSPEEYEITDDPDASTYSNLISMVESGAVQELVIMINFFDGETCFYCSHQIYNSKNTKTE